MDPSLRHYVPGLIAQIVTRRTRDIEGQPKFGSPVVHAAFEAVEEPVTCGSLPGLLWRRNGDAPFWEEVEDFGRDVARVTGVFQRASKAVESFADGRRCDREVTTHVKFQSRFDSKNPLAFFLLTDS